MRVLWISHSSRIGGAELALLEAVEGLTSKNVECTVIVPKLGPLSAQLSKYGTAVPVRYLPWWIKQFRPKKTGVLRRLAHFFRSTSEIRSVIRNYRPDVVITNTLVIPTGAIAAKLESVPHVWFIHEFVEEDHGLSFEFGRKASMRLVNWLSKGVIVNSKSVFERFKPEILPAKMHIVHYAVDIGDVRPKKRKEDSRLYLSLLGRKVQGKGQNDAINAVAILRTKKIQTHLWLIGSGEERFEIKLRAIVQQLGLEDYVEFISHCDDAKSFLLASDIVLMCSKKEALGRVTIEAMKLGKPVIASNSGANGELIRHMETGLLYQVGDPASLAQEIERLYYDPRKGIEMGKQASSWANANFNLDRYSASVIDVLTAAVDK